MKPQNPRAFPLKLSNNVKSLNLIIHQKLPNRKIFILSRRIQNILLEQQIQSTVTIMNKYFRKL